MPLKLRGFHIETEYWDMLEAIRKREGYSSDAFALRKCIEEKHEHTSTNLFAMKLFQKFLGDELYERHIDFLEKKRQEGETLEDVFRRFIKACGVEITKDEWMERIREGAKPDPFKILDPQTCHYRVVDPETNKWYCDGKEIVPAVCVGRQERYLRMRELTGNPKINCRPKGMKKPPLQKKPSNRRFCKRDRVWFNMGEKDCIKCTWLTTECPTKKEALRG